MSQGHVLRVSRLCGWVVWEDKSNDNKETRTMNMPQLAGRLGGQMQGFLGSVLVLPQVDLGGSSVVYEESLGAVVATAHAPGVSVA